MDVLELAVERQLADLRDRYRDAAVWREIGLLRQRAVRASRGGGVDEAAADALVLRLQRGIDERLERGYRQRCRLALIRVGREVAPEDHVRVGGADDAGGRPGRVAELPQQRRQ